MYLTEDTKLFFFSMIVISNAVFFLFWIVKMIEEVKVMIVKKMGVIYIYLFLCGDRQRYEKIKQGYHLKEENDFLREGYMETLR